MYIYSPFGILFIFPSRKHVHVHTLLYVQSLQREVYAACQNILISCCAIYFRNALQLHSPTKVSTFYCVAFKWRLCPASREVSKARWGRWMACCLKSNKMRRWIEICKWCNELAALKCQIYFNNCKIMFCKLRHKFVMWVLSALYVGVSWSK